MEAVTPTKERKRCTARGAENRCTKTLIFPWDLGEYF